MLLQVTGVVILAICIWTKVDQYKYLSLVMLLQVTSTVILAIGIWAKRARFRYLLLHGHAVAGDRYSDPGHRYLVWFKYLSVSPHGHAVAGHRYSDPGHRYQDQDGLG